MDYLMNEKFVGNKRRAAPGVLRNNVRCLVKEQDLRTNRNTCKHPEDGVIAQAISQQLNQGPPPGIIGTIGSVSHVALRAKGPEPSSSAV